jgi:CIC family chloride channel protein
MLGGAVGFLDVAVLHHANGTLGAFALVGMGIVRAPMMSVLIIFEMTGSYELILPLMVSNMIAYTLARHWRRTPVYEVLLLQDGISLPHESPRDISRPGEEFRSESLP